MVLHNCLQLDSRFSRCNYNNNTSKGANNFEDQYFMYSAFCHNIVVES